jgi:sterol desaturase/sphingolipid hydroxylase (fatty acid hydroxylase superfamily)
MQGASDGGGVDRQRRRSEEDIRLPPLRSGVFRMADDMSPPGTSASRGNSCRAIRFRVGAASVIIGYKRWQEQSYLLNRMTLRDLVKAYFTHPAIQTYLLLLAMSVVGVIAWTERPLLAALAAVLAIVVYPFVWYALHRWVLHARWPYKSPLTAALWKRVHFDHHQNPNDLSVLFGGLHTTVSTVFIVTVPIGWLIEGPGGAAAAFATGIATTCFYEFSHCIQHLAYMPKSSFLRRIKRYHLAHHFHNENGNYGITNFLWDRALATFYDKNGDVPRSPTVRNLGYAGDEVERYPWVAELSADKADQFGLADSNNRAS